MALIIHVDGGSRGNPGPAGAGVVIHGDDGTRIHEAGYYLGEQTNNSAEYYALIRALQRAARLGDQPLQIHADSELLVRQITGDYRVKSPRLQQLYEQVQLLLLRVGRWSLRHVPRASNQRADELANLAMDRAGDVIVFDIDQNGEAPGAKNSASGSGDGAAPAPGAALHAVGDAPDERPVHVSVSQPPGPGECPAGGCIPTMTVGSTLPAEVCLHAAHGLITTILAVKNTDAQEFAAVPTLTVHCSRNGCRARFHVSPILSGNGSN